MSDENNNYEQTPAGDSRNNAIGQMLQCFYVTDTHDVPTIDINWGMMSPLRALYERIAWVYDPLVPSRADTNEYLVWAGPLDQKRVAMVLVALFYQIDPDSASWYVGDEGTMLLDHRKAPGEVTMRDARGQAHTLSLSGMLSDGEPRYYTKFYKSIDQELTTIWEILDKILWHYDDIPKGPPKGRPYPEDDSEPLDPEDYPQDL